MSATPESGRWLGPAVALAAAGLLLLLLAAFGLDVLSFPATLWRDHPFDYGNIRFTQETFSASQRLWAYDPLHLLGWMPNVFYNPLATATGAAVTGLLGGGEGAYRVFLLCLVWGTGLAFFFWIQARERGGWFALLLCAGMSYLVYPSDAGILDAGPVQALYTGQWAQRLGIFFALGALARFWRALELAGSDLPAAARAALGAAALLGASSFSHFMSGYGAAAACATLWLLHPLARRLAGARVRPGFLLLPVIVGAGLALLWADFWVPFVSLRAFHELPILGWVLPEAAVDTAREVLLGGLPLLLVPAVGLLWQGSFTLAALSRAVLPLLVLVLALGAGPASAGWCFLLVLAGSLLSARLERGFAARQALPTLGFVLMWLSSGPDGVNLVGLDLTGLVPFGSAVGYAKLAALSRAIFVVWMGLVALDAFVALSRGPRLGRAVLLALAAGGLVLPAVLSLAKADRGAQAFFGWMNRTDRQGALRLLNDVADAARELPPGLTLLVEDTLHHPAGSTLPEGIPNGHLPYLSAMAAGRPVLGGAVATRTLTHPFEHSARGQLLCVDFDKLSEHPEAFERLRRLGVGAVLAHSLALRRALESRFPGRAPADGVGLWRYEIPNPAAPVLGPDGSGIRDAQIGFAPGKVELLLPPHTSLARLPLVRYPFLACSAEADGRAIPCRLNAVRDGQVRFENCRLEGDRTGAIEVDVPWLEVELARPAPSPARVRVCASPPAWPALLMLVAWALAIVWWWRGRAAGADHD
ncbi:MAG: hypothetical protein GYA21_06020 [Myxococcales bacterium]|nr:hypothetical protein [Myxococcales bacterium]